MNENSVVLITPYVRHKQLKSIESQYVITIEEKKPLSMCLVQCLVSCRADAGVGLVEDAKTGILCRIFVEDRAGAVGGAVIDANRLPVGEGLSENRVQALAQIRRYVIDRNDDGEEWRHGSESVREGGAKWRRAGVEERGVKFESNDCTFH